jgi:hypothetical protein
MTAPSPVILARPAVVLLAEEAAVRGFRKRDGRPNAAAFRRWCQRVGVPIHRPEGRKEWVATADVDRAVLGGPPADDLATLAERSASRGTVAA